MWIRVRALFTGIDVKNAVTLYKVMHPLAVIYVFDSLKFYVF